MKSRRDLLKTWALGSGALLVASAFKTPAWAKDAAKKDAAAKTDPKLPKLTKADLVPEDSGIASGLNYCENADKDAKAKKPKCPARKDASKKGQYCGSPCNFYAAAGTVDGVEVGKCILISDPPNKNVSAKGWCNSWAAKM